MTNELNRYRYSNLFFGLASSVFGLFFALYLNDGDLDIQYIAFILSLGPILGMAGSMWWKLYDYKFTIQKKTVITTLSLIALGLNSH